MYHRPQSSIRSFYHLAGEDIAARQCQGTACFVARHLAPERRFEAAAADARVYCLGKCHIAPASGTDDRRPYIEVRSRIPVVLAIRFRNYAG